MSTGDDWSGGSGSSGGDWGSSGDAGSDWSGGGGGSSWGGDSGGGGGGSWDASGSSGDSYTETSYEGWGSRLGKSFMAIPIGLILFAVSFVVLFWNEGRAVHTAQGLAEGKSSVVAASPDKVDPANESKLVHLSGEATSQETLKDPDLGIAAEGAIKLSREVEMYQWTESSKTETRKKLGGGEERITTYTYNKSWVNHPVDSAQFKKPDGHQNPGNWPFQSWNAQSGDVSLGAYKLSDSLVKKIGGAQPITLTSKDLDALPGDWRSSLKLDGTRFYRGDSPSSPQVGDMTIKFEQVRPQTISLLAKQVGASFEPYATQAGTTIERLESGTHSAQQMFESAETENKVISWVVRLVGFILMWVGLAMVFSPLTTLADVVPFIGNIVGFGTGFIAFGIASVLSLVTIAISWLSYRPIIGISVLVGAVLVLFLFSRMAAKRRSQFQPRPGRR